jgi:hypothetical protein
MELAQFHRVLEKEKKKFFLLVPVIKMLTKFQVGLCIFSFVAS